MHTETLNITGMTCGGCTGSVTNALKRVDGVGEVKVSSPTGKATVQYDETRTSPDLLRSAVTHAGYEVASIKADQKPNSKSGCCGSCG